MNDEYQGIETRLDELTKLVKRNQKLTKKLVGAQRRASISRFIYWAVILVATFIGYQQVKPYLQTLSDGYNQVKNTANQLQDLQGDINETLDNPTVNQLQQLLNKN